MYTLALSAIHFITTTWKGLMCGLLVKRVFCVIVHVQSFLHAYTSTCTCYVKQKHPCTVQESLYMWSISSIGNIPAFMYMYISTLVQCRKYSCIHVHVYVDCRSTLVQCRNYSCINLHVYICGLQKYPVQCRKYSCNICCIHVHRLQELSMQVDYSQHTFQSIGYSHCIALFPCSSVAPNNGYMHINYFLVVFSDIHWDIWINSCSKSRCVQRAKRRHAGSHQVSLLSSTWNCHEDSRETNNKILSRN